MQTVTTIGLDIAKSVFQVHGVDAAGQVVIGAPLRPGVLSKVATLFGVRSAAIVLDRADHHLLDRHCSVRRFGVGSGRLRLSPLPRRSGTSLQFGRTSAPIIPRVVATMCCTTRHVARLAQAVKIPRPQTGREREGR